MVPRVGQQRVAQLLVPVGIFVFRKFPVKYFLMLPVIQFRDDLLALLNLSRA